MSGITERLLHVSSVWVYLCVGLVVFAEDAFFVGFVLPGETVAVLGGVAASRSTVSLPLMLAVVIGAAVLGDSVGYEVGRTLGRRLLRWHRLDGRRERIERAQAFLGRRGGLAVLLGRWTAFFRAVMPALAGSSHMPYRTFLAFNAIGGILWGSVVVMLGYLAGDSYSRVEKYLGRGTAVALAVVVVAGLGFWSWRRHRSE
ncbi:membrane protein DedA with SNARE-associated domain [Motilibacter rhizosphaerae]|uniref:Membrane protein DedA with SNARE-associated domain n=1 Tax=Motilibacter rhizosphaerae TaxID=598652 RepID=A0A4Q7NPP8_9ACTN|nr:DedA family protein [Motilibacter rhizosphaerae]RZS87261.1 membrane protein DedA with SNARE-associated domain [Motilibacter rhizosphaerae]